VPENIEFRGILGLDTTARRKNGEYFRFFAFLFSVLLFCHTCCSKLERILPGFSVVVQEFKKAFAA
jgi:hypothetical protein